MAKALPRPHLLVVTHGEVCLPHVSSLIPDADFVQSLPGVHEDCPACPIYRQPKRHPCCQGTERSKEGEEAGGRREDGDLAGRELFPESITGG